MIEKIIEKFEELKKHGACRSIDCEKCKYTNDCFEGEMSYKVAIDNCKAIVQEVAKEYGNASDNDLTVVSSLPSLYPLQPFEEEAIHKVVASAKDGGWIPVTERLPEPFQRVLAYDAWDDSMTIEHLQENDSFIDSVVAWMPLPIAPYQKGE